MSVASSVCPRCSLARGLANVALVLSATMPRAGTRPYGFRESVVFSGLTQPTAFEFASDGRTFVAEKHN